MLLASLSGDGEVSLLAAHADRGGVAPALHWWSPPSN